MAYLGLVCYVRTTFIALAAVVVRCVVLAPSSLWVLGISAARLLVASKFASESCFGGARRVLLAETSRSVARKTRDADQTLASPKRVVPHSCTLHNCTVCHAF